MGRLNRFLADKIELLLLSILILSLSCVSSYADENASDIDGLIDVSALHEEEKILHSVEVVNVGGFARKAFDSQSNVFVITREEILRTNARDIGDILDRVPGLEVYRTREGSIAVSAQGISGWFSNRFELQVNGIPFHSLVLGENLWDQIPVPVDYIDQIVVVVGPSSSLYGENALGGAVNIITRVSDKDEKEEKSVVFTGGSRGLYRGATRVRSNVGNGSLDVTLLAENSDGYPVSVPESNVEVEDDYLKRKYRSGLMRFTNKLNDSTLAEFQFSHSNGKNGGLQAFTSDISRLDSQYNTFSFNVKRRINRYQSLLFQALYSDNDVATDGQNGSNIAKLEENRLVLDVSKTIDTHKFKTIFGFNMRNNNIEGLYLSPGEHAFDLRSLYIHSDYDFNDRWALLASLRATDHSEADRAVSWKLDVRRKLGNHQVIRFGSGVSHRQPVAVTLDVDSFDTIPVPGLGLVPLDRPLVVLSPEMDYEKIQSYQLGYEKRNDDSTLKLDFFFHRGTDFFDTEQGATPNIITGPNPLFWIPLESSPGVPIPQLTVVNRATALHSKGMTFFWRKQLTKKLETRVSGTYLEAKYSNSADSTALTARRKGVFNLQYDPNDRETFDLIIRYRDKATPPSLGSEPVILQTPSFASLDLSWRNRFKAGTLGLAVRNVLDRDLYGPPVGNQQMSPLAGREYQVSWTVKF